MLASGSCWVQGCGCSAVDESFRRDDLIRSISSSPCDGLRGLRRGEDIPLCAYSYRLPLSRDGIMGLGKYDSSSKEHVVIPGTRYGL